ncbi:uncharacterized protein LOC125756174 isoform X1 [Rhipicephalus sanguineus]|uniref:uncharacterized protein LOC125756174 isoform X1 n=1 Tax=Rhipicephalus sanguineus TaxID=34632 RepID=UPI0020C47E4F|nr:uncharacterized protein LOC125756174 isoform X1 [Rhipicephalus sanguineus]
MDKKSTYITSKALRRRKRARKSRTPKAVATTKAKATSTAPAAETPVKRGRGRPPGSGKKKLAASEGSAKKSSPAVPVASPQKNGTSGPECDRCSRTFATERGLKMHQRWPCKPEAAKDDADESCRLPLDDVMDSDSDSDVPLGKVASGKGTRSKGNAEDGIDGSPDHPKGRLASANKPQLICQRCGLSYDPKRDGPRCKHCTRDNEHSGESGDEEDKASGSRSPRSWQEELYGWNHHNDPSAFDGLFSFTAGKFAPLNVFE